MMRYGIPKYRLPRDVLDARDRAHRGAGRRDRAAITGSTISRPSGRTGGFDAVFVAVGAHLSKRVDIPARDAGRMLDAVSFLRSVASGERAGDRPSRRGLRRRQHRDGRRAHGASRLGATRR